jgi:hypothetical protein
MASKPKQAKMSAFFGKITKKKESAEGNYNAILKINLSFIN